MLVLNYVFSLVYRDIPNMERVRFCFFCDGERKTEFQAYDEAWLSSLFKVRGHDRETGLGLG